MTERQIDFAFYGIALVVSLAMVYILDQPQFYIIVGWMSARLYDAIKKH